VLLPCCRASCWCGCGCRYPCLDFGSRPENFSSMPIEWRHRATSLYDVLGRCPSPSCREYYEADQFARPA
jgi:hypothetical protein